MEKSLDRLFEEKYRFDPKEKGISIDKIISKNFFSLESFFKTFDKGDNNELLQKALHSPMVLQEVIFSKKKCVVDGFEIVFPDIQFYEHEGTSAISLDGTIKTLFFYVEIEKGEYHFLLGAKTQEETIALQTHTGFYEIEKLSIKSSATSFGIVPTQYRLLRSGEIEIAQDFQNEKGIVKTEILKNTEKEVEFIVRTAFIDEQWDYEELISKTFKKKACRYRFWLVDGKFHYEIEEDVKQSWLKDVKDESDLVKHPLNSSIWSLITTPEKYTGTFFFVDALENFYVKISDVWVKTERSWFDRIVDQIPEIKKEYEDYLTLV